MLTIYRKRFKALRDLFPRLNINGIIVPHMDEHLSEQLPSYAERLAWLTGFSGSAGMAIIMENQASLFVDGRYILQAQNEVNLEIIDVYLSSQLSPFDWLKSVLKAGGKVGIDPWLHTEGETERYRALCQERESQLIDLEKNPIDQLWHDQPLASKAPVIAHELKYAGKATADKVAEISAFLNKRNIDSAIITQLDSIAWLLNMRGSDTPYTPVVSAFVLLNKDETVDLFIDEAKITSEIREYLGKSVKIHLLNQFEHALIERGEKAQCVLVDPKSTPYRIFDLLLQKGGKVVRDRDPCLLPKACKNDTEIAGMRSAHIRDGVALTTLLAWLSHNVSRQKVTEMEVAERLYQLRSQQKLFRGLSFPTISAAGSHGAIIHYRASKTSNCVIEPTVLYLLDSGGQYLDGTTDVTRTMSFAPPTSEYKERFTRVLKGHISLARTCFPKGTCGRQLDILARHALWEIGVDYDHGTGHGVGSYLNVHEGPQSISKGGPDLPLEAGMILSNEPGYYKQGAYGIRIESLVVVIERKDMLEAERPMLGFETLTMVPICRGLIEPKILHEAEIEWLNHYHAQVREVLTPLLDAETAAWLEAETEAF